MSQSLDNHLDNILKEAVCLLSLHQEALFAEWEEVLHHLKTTNKKSVEAFSIIRHILSDYLESYATKHNDIDCLLSLIRKEINSHFDKSHGGEVLIYALNLLENASHTVLKAHIVFSSRLHPSVHYLFSKINEAIVFSSTKVPLTTEAFCQKLLANPNLNVKSIARIEERKDGYICSQINNSQIDGAIEPISHSFSNWEELMQSLRKDHGEHANIPIPYNDQLLVIGTKTPQSLTSIMGTVLQLRAEEQQQTKQQDRWKDAVILFNEWIIRSQTFEHAIENISFGFGYFLPFKRCALFKFANKESDGIGLYGHELNNDDIRVIKENIGNIPALNKSLVKLKSQGHEIRNFQPIHIAFARNEFPDKYVELFQLASLMIVPIYVPEEGKIIGGIILDQGPGIHFAPDKSLYPALMKFGQSSGELLSKYIKANIDDSFENNTNKIALSPREIEIIKLLADGASTTEAATKLYLSEFTVRDHISHIMKKFNAQNRTEATVKAIRMGVIN